MSMYLVFIPLFAILLSNLHHVHNGNIRETFRITKNEDDESQEEMYVNCQLNGDFWSLSQNNS